MRVVSVTKLRKNMAAVMADVRESHDIAVITQGNEPPMVLMSLEDYSSMQETLYIYSTPANAKRITEGLKEVETMIAARKSEVGNFENEQE